MSRKEAMPIDVVLANKDCEFRGYYMLKKDNKGLLISKDPEPERVIFIPYEQIAYIEFPYPKDVADPDDVRL